MTNLERAVSVLLALIVGGLVICSLQFADLNQSYSDFIVGWLAFSASSKAQDLYVFPAAIIAVTATYMAAAWMLRRCKAANGEEFSSRMAMQMILLAMPALAAIAYTVGGGKGRFNADLVLFSVASVAYLVAVTTRLSVRPVSVRPEHVVLGGLTVGLLALIPLEASLVAGRLQPQGGMFALADMMRMSQAILWVGLFYSFGAWLIHPLGWVQSLPKLLLVGQLGTAGFFAVIYPARFQLPNGELIDPASKWLVVLVCLLGLLTMADVIRRFRRTEVHGDDGMAALLSPFALFAVVVAFKVQTFIPGLSADDYHFGEKLVGWWSYRNGAIPYVDIMPPHGFLEDDLPTFLSQWFLDGTAASAMQGEAILRVLVGLIALVGLYRSTGSLLLAVLGVSMAFFARLAWMFLTPFFCVWFLQTLLRHPSRWLAVWIVTAPIAILLLPPQGVVITAASGILAAFQAWQMLRKPEKRQWKPIAVAIGVFALFALVLPLVPMLYAAIRYVLENGSINQLAYGIPWKSSWSTGNTILSAEVLRMTWAMASAACVWLAISISRTQPRSWLQILPLLTMALFMLLMIPYAMGRIDPGSLSRPGIFSIGAWFMFLPLVAWPWLTGEWRLGLVSAMIVLGGAFGAADAFSSSVMVANLRPSMAVPLLQDGAKLGMPNIGKVVPVPEHLERLSRLNALLNKELGPDETFLDLTNRNAHYVYFNRKPPIEITAPYNLAPVVQQKRAVEALSRSLPKLAVLEDRNVIHDGGGMALRAPYLMRFVLDHYDAVVQDGFIIGYRKGETSRVRPVSLPIKPLTDVNWRSGVSRSDAAVLIDAPALLPLLKVGMQVQVAGGDLRQITRVSNELSVIWLTGAPLVPDVVTAKDGLVVVLDFTPVQPALFERAFGQKNLARIPMAWGRSAASLQKKMKPVAQITDEPMALNQMSKNGNRLVIAGLDPFAIYDVSALGLSGSKAGLLQFDFTCEGQAAEPVIQVFWWGDDAAGPTEENSVRFTAANGRLIVPMDAMPRWSMTKRITHMRLDLDNATACKSVHFDNLGLYDRVF